MKKILKFLLIALVWLVIALVVMGGALALSQPIGAALKLVGILFVGWLLFLMLRKLIARHRAKKRAESLVNIEQPEDDDSEGPGWRGWLDRAPRTSLERRFNALARLLSKSRLREQGDPLYVLPWYLMLGEQGSGKTELLANAGLSRPTVDDASLHSEGDTLDWWLYNEAIVLDAPGSYVGVDEDSPPHSEWPALLRMLSEGRSREPLNGVVVTVSYEQLKGDPDRLFDYGRRLRKRIDSLMRGTKLHLPVYVVVTKCDQMSGFSAWCGNLSADSLGQPMGLLNTAARPGAGGDGIRTFVREVIATVSSRIGRLMLVLFNQRQPDPDLLCLPRNTEALAEPLSAFVDGLFQGSSFEESPRFQGVYVTGRQREGENAPQAFARDLFTHVLPANRKVHSTLSGAERAERKARGIVRSGWGLAVIVLLAVLVGTWASHKTYLQSTSEQYAGQFGHAEAMPERIDRMHRLRVLVDDVRVETASWRMPWFGLPGGSGPEFVQDLKQTFYERVRQEVLNPLDQRFDRALRVRADEIESGEIPEDELAFLISSLIERINLLAAYVDGLRGKALQDFPGPYDDSGIFFTRTVDPLTIERANGLYKQALIWAPDPVAARTELSRTRDQLVNLLTATGERMSWLIPWANDRLAGQGLQLDDFWSGSGYVEDPPVIRAAFTTEGYEAIQYFLNELEGVGIDPERFQELRGEFDAYYRRRYLQEWKTFAEAFERGREILNGQQEWYQAVNILATQRNPFFQLLQAMFENMQHYEVADLPEWAQLARYYDEMRSFSPEGAPPDYSARNRVISKLGLNLIKKLGPLGKSLAKSGKKGLKTKKKLSAGDSGVSPSQRALQLEAAGKILAQYRTALEDIAFNSDVRSVSHQATAALFRHPDNPGKGEGPKAQAHKKMRELQAITGTVTQYNEAFWDVFTGPLDLVTRYYTRESACYIEERWEKEFLVQLAGVPEARLPEYIFGTGRVLWSFMEQKLAPFIERRPGAGYVPTNAGGYHMPFTDDFLMFATLGREQMNGPRESHAVRIEGAPSAANGDAVFQPARTLVQLQCQEGDQQLANYNYPVAKVFNWNTTCGNTILEIDIGRHTLVKRWEGQNGFPEFLKAFRTGTVRFTPEDFPRKQSILEDYGVEYLTVGFQFNGHQPVIDMIRQMPSDPPRQIVACWD